MRIIDDIILPEGPQVSRDLKVCWALTTWLNTLLSQDFI